MVGSVRKNITKAGENYIRYDEGLNQSYKVNGYNEYNLNTGWVDDAFEEVVSDLLLSEHIVLYQGATSIKLTMEDNGKNIKNQRVDKMINYSFRLKEAKQIISIV